MRVPKILQIISTLHILTSQKQELVLFLFFLAHYTHFSAKRLRYSLEMLKYPNKTVSSQTYNFEHNRLEA